MTNKPLTRAQMTKALKNAKPGDKFIAENGEVWKFREAQSRKVFLQHEQKGVCSFDKKGRMLYSRLIDGDHLYCLVAISLTP